MEKHSFSCDISPLNEPLYNAQLPRQRTTKFRSCLVDPDTSTLIIKLIPSGDESMAVAGNRFRYLNDLILKLELKSFDIFFDLKGVVFSFMDKTTRN